MANARASDVVLLCNPNAGGRWRVLADVLDSVEAQSVRRIVTDEMDDIADAIAEFGPRARLLCIYGGDGTIFRVIADLFRRPVETPPRLALLGGGTMNVTSRWCGMGSSPGENFRRVMHGFHADLLLTREVPLLAVTVGDQTVYGFTFGIGPLVRVLDRYEHGSKGRLRAVGTGLATIAAAVGRTPRSLRPVLEELDARLTVDGELLPYRRFAAVFANVTGAINPLIEPFVGARTRDSFHFLAYAVSAREFALRAPLLARARLPIDPRSLLTPMSTWREAALSFVGRGHLPHDPRYVNRPARELVVESAEKQFTVDGEILPLTGGRAVVRLGPTIQLAQLTSGRVPRSVRKSKPPVPPRKPPGAGA